jgi:hypothetical protein
MKNNHTIRALWGLSVFALLSGSTFSLAESPATLLASWSFDDRVETRYVDGIEGQALAMGNDASRVVTRNLGQLKSATISLWMRPTACHKAYSSLVSSPGWEGTAPHFLLLNDGRVRFSVKEASAVDVSSKTVLLDRMGDWVHLAAVVDGEENEFRLYVDGKLDQAVPYTLPAPLDLRELWWGAWNKGDRYLNGALDELRVDSKPLSSADIASLADQATIDVAPLARWKLDGDASDSQGKRHASLEKNANANRTPTHLFESVLKTHDELYGYANLAGGVRGDAYQGDGRTTKLIRKAEHAPQLGDRFSVESWIAPQAYPWNWAAIANQEKENKSGWFFGISARGFLGLHLAIDGRWIQFNTEDKIPLLQWSHVMATYDASAGAKLYINGELVASHGPRGAFTPAPDQDLWLGQSHTKTYPEATERRYSATFLSAMVLEGLLDEVRIHDGVLTPEEARKAYERFTPEVAQPLQYHALPSGPDGPAEFGAVHTRLNYAPAWERPWKIGDYADILVRFDENPTKIVFWRGMNYAANYVSENNFWSGDQSLECNSPETGCYEHMADKRCEYAHARIIENHDARVVVHWRYAVIGIDGTCLRVNPDTEWGDFADEYFTIYPDGVTVRHPIAQDVRGGYQWQETTLFTQPGLRPEDMVEDAALTLANREGEAYTYNWADGPPKTFEKPANANIQLTNFKAQYKPFVIFEPGVVIRALGIGPNGDFSKFPCWNHWPIAQLRNDGRKALAADRTASFALSDGRPKLRFGPNRSHSAVFLYGMTDKPISELVPLERSWNTPPAIAVEDNALKAEYNKFQRAYVVDATAEIKKVTLTLAGSEDSPVYHPAFVLKNWGKRDVKLRVDGKRIPRGKDFRYGFQQTVDGADLVVWVKVRGTKELKVKFDETK